ncbi:MAG: DoxX family membrane protein [Candidatus Firestonebacteria bacterium]|nr:DoxX family membrane protein [Candidatus Firestonebacteria bacterium]
MIKKLLSNNKTMLAFRLLMGGVFILASIDKILSPAGFSLILKEYRLIPEILTPLTALVLPWIEFFAGFFMLLNVFTQSNALIMIGLNTAYILGMAINLSWGLVHECGCFTIFGWSEPIGGAAIFRDIIFILLCLPLFIFGTNEIKWKEKQRQILPS